MPRERRIEGACTSSVRRPLEEKRKGNNVEHREAGRGCQKDRRWIKSNGEHVGPYRGSGSITLSRMKGEEGRRIARLFLARHYLQGTQK